MRSRPFLSVCLLLIVLDSSVAAREPFQAKTAVTLAGGFWEINGKPTYEGCDCEGLLMNARMVNATFNDRNEKTRPKGFDADKNTAGFLARLPEYVGHGVRAVTLNLQGGMPGYEGAINSVFDPDGSLRKEGLKRVQAVIETCDKLGAVVILGYFYQRQDQILRDEAAVRRAVVEASRWIHQSSYKNVIVEIATEHEHAGFDHDIIRNPAGCAALIRLARKTAPGLLVSASGTGNARVANDVASASSFLLPRFNATPVSRIAQMVVRLGKQSKAIVCNEDDKTGGDAVKALETCVENLCSWGYMNRKKNLHWPFEYDGAGDDPALYHRLMELSTPTKR